MNNFSDFNIKSSSQTFVGDKIKIKKILNVKITVHGYSIEPSKFEGKGNGKCLFLQIELDKVMNIVFTGSKHLQDMIQQVPKEKMPFETTIVELNESYQFT